MTTVIRNGDLRARPSLARLQAALLSIITLGVAGAATVAAAPPIQHPSSRHTPRSKKPPKITFSVCIQKFSRNARPLRGQHKVSITLPAQYPVG